MSSVIKSYRVCRLCLQKHPEVEMIKLFNKETNELETHISTILMAHLWFLIIENDDHSKLICLKCWRTIKKFHLFYVEIKNAQKSLFNASYSVSVAAGNNKNISGNDFMDEEKQQIIKLEEINDDTSSAIFIQPNITIKVEELVTEPDLKVEEKKTATKKSKLRTTKNKKSNSKAKCLTSAELEKSLVGGGHEEGHAFSDSSRPSPATSPSSLPDWPSDTSQSPMSDKLKKTTTPISSASISNVKPKIKRKRAELKSSKSDEDTDGNDNANYSSDEDTNSDEKIKKTRKKTKKNSTDNKAPVDLAEKQKEIDENNAKIREYFKMECDLCKRPFNCYREINIHYHTAHDQKRGYLTCCGGHKYYVLQHMLDHIAVHINPETFKCNECGRKYFTRAKYSHHMKEHDPNIVRVQCDQCPKTFRKQYDLDHHKRMRHYTEEDKKFNCDICNKKFLTKHILQRHMDCMHSTKYVPEIICDICGREFKSKELFHNHRLDHFNVDRPKLQCSICENWFKTKDSLRVHKKRHRTAPGTCSFCGKLMNNKWALDSHIRLVHCERNKQCTMCDKAYKSDQMLKEHIASHTGHDLYTCTYCPRTFKAMATFHKHRKHGHRLEWERDRGKPISMITQIK